MEQEIRLINLLGYQIKQKYETRWIILDENNHEVGFIQRKKIKNKNKKLNNPAEYGYLTEIESDTISYKNISKEGENSVFQYSFDIKRDEHDYDHVEITIGNYPSIEIWSNQFGYMTFHISYNGIYTNFKSQTSSYNLEETIICNTTSQNRKEYTYQITYCNKDQDISQDKTNTKSLVLSATSDFGEEYLGKVHIAELAYKNDQSTIVGECSVDGTVDDVIVKHQDGIYAMKHFRYLLNNVLPFKEEIIEKLVENTPYLEDAKYFFPDIIKRNQNLSIEKNKKRTE